MTSGLPPSQSGTTPAVVPPPPPLAPPQSPPVGWFDTYAARYTGNVITEEAWSAAATNLGCEPKALKTVATVESGKQGAFWKPGWPVILYERHLFSRATARRFDKDHPDLSAATAYRFATREERTGALTADVYAWTQEANYARLEKAYALDPAAALASASWGKFQILGQNHVAAGFPTSVQDYVGSMCASEKDQLNAFVQFLKQDNRLVTALREKNWGDFAQAYNGKNYRQFNYDTRMKAAYDAA